MLSKETKKKIDDARDILVGQLPLPSDQVELITIALIYKFMDDQDEDLRQLGYGEAFFSGDLKDYSWQRLMSNEIDAEERVSKFIRGIEEIQKAAHIPQLFRDIFRNTFLKFRDGRTLFLFLGVINGFCYDHGEELGNAFEYLLMSMGAQGENGQFRTPRNIIDFIVEVVDPDKGDTILDPAGGTAGFLLVAYKHILRKNTTGMEHYRVTLNNEEIEGIPVNWGDKLTAQDLERLGSAIEGYDITPLMVRLARVNLYLHQFKSPRIHEYDTLTSDGRWKDKFDCILTNPPFMTPKGGVKPHSRFRIRASKAEILFSDYILEHLTPDGMAGFIVPEGIIFQNSGDYVALRKWLVEDAGLWAVVSLPSQVFQPYSGVKTSIIFVDRKVARGRDEIILVKVENDGYSLNTNRTPIARNDLPEALNILTMGKKSLADLRDYLDRNKDKPHQPKALIKPRSEFARLDAYKAQTSAYGLIRKQYEKCKALEEEITVLPLPAGEGRGEGEKKLARLQAAFTKQSAEFKKIVDVKYENIKLDIQSFFDTRLKDAVIAYGADRARTGNLSFPLREHLDREREYNLSFDKYAGGDHLAHVSQYEMVPLVEICVINPGKTELRDLPADMDVSFVPMQDLSVNNMSFTPKERRKLGEVLKGAYTNFQNNDVLLAKVTPCFENGKAGLAKNLTNGIGFGSSEFYVLRTSDRALPEFVYYFVTSKSFRDNATPQMTGTGGLQRVPKNVVSEFLIPLPPLEIQQQIVAEIEAYQKVIDGCNLIIVNYRIEIEIEHDCPMEELGNLVSMFSGGTPSKREMRFWEGKIPWVSPKDMKIDYIFDTEDHVSLEAVSNSATKLVGANTLLCVVRSGILQHTFPVAITLREMCFNQDIIAISTNSSKLDIRFLFYIFKARSREILQTGIKPGVTVQSFHNGFFKTYKIPLPPLETQQKIVADLEEDLRAVEGARRLKAKMEARIRAAIDRVWGKGSGQ
jgi:type I restriction enzyme M protein